MRRAPSSRSPQSRLGGSGGATGGSSFRIPFPLLLLLLLPQAPFAKLSRLPLQSPDSFRIERTSVLKFFPAPRDGEVINASAVVLTGRSACRPKEDEVQHKIVLIPSISLHGSHGCSLDDVYEALDDCGARAAVFMLAPIHNFVAPYWHMSWDRWKFANRRMPVVTVSRSSLMRAMDGRVSYGRQAHQRLTEIQKSFTRLADEGNFQLLLAKPWDTTFLDGFESVWWMLIFRVALTSWALFTAATAWVNTLHYHRRRAEWAPGRVVCLIQVPVNLVIAVLLASGLYVSVCRLLSVSVMMRALSIVSSIVSSCSLYSLSARGRFPPYFSNVTGTVHAADIHRSLHVDADGRSGEYDFASFGALHARSFDGNPKRHTKTKRLESAPSKAAMLLRSSDVD